jgi:hypothetical protein
MLYSLAGGVQWSTITSDSWVAGERMVCGWELCVGGVLYTVAGSASFKHTFDMWQMHGNVSACYG